MKEEDIDWFDVWCQVSWALLIIGWTGTLGYWFFTTWSRQLGIG